jgi:hypothetical protein
MSYPCGSLVRPGREPNVIDKVADMMYPHRPGIKFPRFGATLVDININGFQIKDPHLQERLRRLQMSGIEESVTTRQAQTTLEGVRRRSSIEREQASLESETAKFKSELDLKTTEEVHETLRKKIVAEHQTAIARVKSSLELEMAAIGKESEVKNKTYKLAQDSKIVESELAKIDSEIAELKKTSELLSLVVVEKKTEIERIDSIDRQKAEAAAIINTSVLPTLGAHLAEIRDSLVADKLIGAFGSVSSFRGMDIVELAAQSLSALPGVGNILSRLRGK